MTKTNELDLARQMISKALLQKGEYTHNLISSILRRIAKNCGCVKADMLIDEFKLTKKFGIQKQENTNG